ncbi:FAD-dependent oxidoreductase [Tenggerimyces flavus]|uniref:ferredoxin--NADP(+) reductase n=1 Tax=Tenggerimyces flavus TaxID=1708749 RepID=A0ABV7YKU3_9ACTN|nr:FAD-dependent oxidoreductase [Tenggerimyces flavus]MBM7787766.1 ferredoxin--NADP+ reductase [Tenggerimyces flavus]
MTDPVDERPARIAIVGAGPAGIYAADSLERSGVPVSVDVLEHLATPYGLVRYGVAPDHPKTRTIAAVLGRMLDAPQVRFLGNVAYGTEIDLATLRRHYDAVIYAVGAADGRRLGIPGEDLPGSLSATAFVEWYNDHPHCTVDVDHLLEANAVAVIGAGNVAIDVARVLLASRERLAKGDVSDEVLDALHQAKVEDVHLIARRGPVEAKFTTLELRELGHLEGVDVRVDPADIPADDPPDAPRRVRTNLAVFRDWATRPATDAPRRLHLHFWRRPVEIRGDEHGITEVVLDGQETLAVQAILAAVGYKGRPLADLPFDEQTGTLPNREGRVVDENGEVIPGVYAAGWIKRGPSGVIGTNKADAAETVRALLADLPTLTPAQEPAEEAIDARLRKSAPPAALPATPQPLA